MGYLSVAEPLGAELCYGLVAYAPECGLEWGQGAEQGTGCLGAVMGVQVC